MNCSYEKEQERLRRLWEEIESSDEVADDDEDEGNLIEDIVEKREDSNSEQEAESDRELKNDEEAERDVESQPYFTGKDGITQ
ncbi:unnamed protein product [Acanthoscelides obtectus]|uniref:Uncharacterized protein n=1 Tax=Acanthoscelides obtectus TaxID=200917 RepID=A0A9P0LY20_ACAOB|nr:unnamed protein product [Acanthoscelides obtectus]CAK1652089.1 hypothetical protein AOBTE_LOCUS17672 [Acanthoscelides obtectus]